MVVNKKQYTKKCLLTLYLQPGSGSPFLTAGPTVGSSPYAAAGSAPSSTAGPGDLEKMWHWLLPRQACSVTASMGRTSNLTHKYLLRKIQMQNPQAGGCSLQWPWALVMTTFVRTQTYNINLQATDRSRAVSQQVIFCRADAICHILKVLHQQNTWFNAKSEGVSMKPVAPLMVFERAIQRVAQMGFNYFNFSLMLPLFFMLHV